MGIVRNSHWESCLGDKGVVLPIMAVLLAGIFAVLVGLGLDASGVKKASTELIQLNETICRTAANDALFQKQALARFSSQLNELLAQGAPKRSRIVKAHIYIPTMPEDGSFPDTPATSVLPQRRGAEPFQALAALFDRPSEIPCNLRCTGLPECEHDCHFHGETGGDFPPGLWNNVSNTGNSMACELTAVVGGIIHRSRTISAKSMWWTPVRGRFDYSTNDKPGLAVIVAPHMTTNALDERFLFDSSRLSQPFLRHHDPLYDFGGADETIAFTGSPQARRYFNTTDGVLGAAEISDDNNKRKDMLVSCMNPAVMVRNILLGSIMEYASRHGQLRRGTEVLLAGTQSRYARNPGVSSHARANPTQMVAFGEDIALESFQVPYVFYDSGYRHDISDPKINETWPQSELWAPDEFGAPQGGLLDPFNNSTNPYLNFTPVNKTHPHLNVSLDQNAQWDSVRKHHALLVNQLRYCYHMYFGHVPDGKTRPDVLSSSNNAEFEPEEFLDRPYYSTTGGYRTVKEILRPQPFPDPGNVYWDQECPWGEGHGCNMRRTRRLDASELMWALGSIQKCPYQEEGLPPSISSSGSCVKPATIPVYLGGTPEATNDLRPDILGALQHLSGMAPPNVIYYRDPAGAQILRGTTPLEAVRSPGLFPLAYSSAFDGQLEFLPPVPPLTEPWYPFGRIDAVGDGIYVEPTLPLAGPESLIPILIVTHQRLAQGEMQAIESLVRSPSFANRPITVVYIPVSEVEGAGGTVNPLVIKQIIMDFRRAFNISAGVSGDQRTGNALFVLSPYLPRYNDQFEPDAVFPFPYTGTASERYRKYWHDLIQGNVLNIESIDGVARNIFRNRILMHDLKF